MVQTAFGQGTNLFGLEYGTTSGLGNKDIRDTVAQIINVALSLLGIVALVIILAGGFKWMTAGGNDEKVSQAKRIIRNSSIGLFIIVLAYVITKFVFKALIAAGL